MPFLVSPVSSVAGTTTTPRLGGREAGFRRNGVSIRPSPYPQTPGGTARRLCPGPDTAWQGSWRETGCRGDGESKSVFICRLLQLWDQLLVHDGILCQRFESPDLPSTPACQDSTILLFSVSVLTQILQGSSSSVSLAL